jgi:hypothetical protein
MPLPRNSAWTTGFLPFPFSAGTANFNSGGTLPLLPLDVENILRNPSPFVSQSCESTARENCRSASMAHYKRTFGHSTSSARRAHSAFSGRHGNEGFFMPFHFQNLPDATQSGQFEKLCRSKSFRIERITSSGQPRINSGTIRRGMNGCLFFRAGQSSAFKIQKRHFILPRVIGL